MIYENLTQASGATGFDRNFLRAAKAHGCPGFIHHRINWELAGPWIEANKAQIEAWADESLENIKKENLIKDGLLKDLEIQKRKGEYISPDDVKQFLTSMGVAQSAILKKMIKELPPKCVGRPVGEIEQMVEATVLEIFNVFKDGTDKWLKDIK